MNTTATQAFSIEEVLKASWALTQKEWKKWLLIILFSALIVLAFVIISGILNFIVRIPNFLDSLAFWLLGLYILIIVTRGSLAIVRGQALDIKALTKLDSQLALGMMGGTLLYSLVVFVGLVLLIIPGIIASIMFYFYSFSLVDAGTNAISALEDSMNLTRGNKLRIFLFNLVLGLIQTIVFGIPMAVATGIFMAIQSSGAGLGIMVLVSLFVGVVMIALSLAFAMVSLSATAYMYTKMRALTPLPKK